MEGWIALPLLISAGGRPNVFVMSDTSWAVAGVIRPAKSPVTLLWEGLLTSVLSVYFKGI